MKQGPTRNHSNNSAESASGSIPFWVIDEVGLSRYQEELTNAKQVSSIIVLVHLQDSKKILEILLDLKSQVTQAAIVVISEESSQDFWKKIVNDFNIEGWFHSLEDFQVQLPLLISKLRAKTQRDELRREARKQIRELESLTKSLEKIVDERTEHISFSKKEEEAKLQQTRQLTRLVKEFGSSQSLQELLLAVRKELKKYDRLGEPALLYQLIPEKLNLITFDHGQIQSSVISQAGWDIDQPKKLAQVLGRPLIKPRLYPIELRTFKEFFYQSAKSYLLIEMGLSREEEEDFNLWFKERLQAISIACDRLFLEEEMQLSAFRWERTFDGLKDPIAIVDRRYQVVRSNRKFSVQQGLCYQIFANRSEPCVNCPLNASLESSGAVQHQVEIRNKVFSVTSYPIRLGGNSTAVLQYEDMTQARDLRLKVLQNEKMSAIGLLAGNIAHELNNPLTGIRSLAQVLLSEVQNNKVKKEDQLIADLKEIEKAAARSQSIIRNLLDFTEDRPVKSEVVPLNELIEKTIPFLKVALRMHRLHNELQAEGVYIDVVPQLFQQVVFNLITNACQAMTQTGDLFLRTFMDGERAVFEVQDTGVGIDKENLEKIFEPFFTTKKEGSGTGLGLSLTKKVVDSFGGTISVQSEKGHGATFRISLPIVKREMK